MKPISSFKALKGLIYSFTIISLASFEGVAFANPKSDYYIQQAIARYYPTPKDARSLATSGSSDTNCFGSICSYLNPAGLGKITNKEISSSLATYQVNGDEFISEDNIEQSEDRFHLLFAIPLGDSNSGIAEYGTITIGYSRYQGESNDQIQTTPDGHTRNISYGYNLNPKLSIGYSFTFYDDQLNSQLADLHSHARILHMLGTQYEISEKTKLGANFKLGTGQSDTEDYTKGSNGLSKPREYGINIGISRDYQSFQSFLGLEYSSLESEGNLQNVSSPVVIGSDESGDLFSIKTGLENQVSNNIILRAGTRWLRVNDYNFEREDLKTLSGTLNSFGFSAGIGYLIDEQNSQANAMRLEYGFEYLTAADGQSEHRISFIIPFA